MELITKTSSFLENTFLETSHFILEWGFHIELPLSNDEFQYGTLMVTNMDCYDNHGPYFVYKNGKEPIFLFFISSIYISWEKKIYSSFRNEEKLKERNGLQNRVSYARAVLVFS